MLRHALCFAVLISAANAFHASASNSMRAVHPNAHQILMGVKVKVLEAAPPGAPKPKNGDILKVQYTGWLATGMGTKGKQFDSSRGGFGPFQKPPFTFALGRNRVIKAWDIGVAKMKVGEKALLTCSSDLCYGKAGAGPIPPNANLLFEVELIGIDGYQPNVFEQQKQSGSKR